MSTIGIFAFTLLRHLTFCRISRHPMIVERCIIAHSIRLDETILMSYNTSFYDHWMPRYSTKRQKSAFFTFTILRHLTFCWISRHPMIIERCTIAHSIRLDEMILMSYSACLYDHWMPKYSTKCQKSAFFTFTILRHLTFCWISRHPMIVERCTIAH